VDELRTRLMDALNLTLQVCDQAGAIHFYWLTRRFLWRS
jgi:hypothetical protein